MTLTILAVPVLAFTAAGAFGLVAFIGLFVIGFLPFRKRDWWMRWYNRLSRKERKEKLRRDPLFQMTVAVWGSSPSARRLRIALTLVGFLLLATGLIGWLATK